jgi:predicted RNA-binding protein
MPNDPRVEVMKQQVEAQAAKDQADAQYKQQKLQQDAQVKAQEMQTRNQENMQNIQARLAELQEELKKEMLRQEAEDRRVQAQIRARLEMNESDNQTAKQLAALEVATGERIGVSTGTGINPNPRAQ